MAIFCILGEGNVILLVGLASHCRPTSQDVFGLLGIGQTGLFLHPMGLAWRAHAVCPASLQIHINGLCLSHPASLAPCFPPALASLLPCVPPVLPPLSSVSFLPLVPLPSLAGCASCTSHPACSVASHGVTWHSLLDAER
eukprot:365663-Chlamydomonas_euryale.AAC.13